MKRLRAELTRATYGPQPVVLLTCFAGAHSCPLLQGVSHSHVKRYRSNYEFNR